MTIKLEITIYDGILLNSRAYEGNVCLNSVSFRARLKDANEALCLSSLCKLFHVLAPLQENVRWPIVVLYSGMFCADYAKIILEGALVNQRWPQRTARSNLSIANKVMLHKTTRNGDFYRNTAFQHCCDIVSNDYSIVPTLQCCVAL